MVVKKKSSNNTSITVGKLITLLSQYKDYEIEDMQVVFSKAGVRFELEFFGDDPSMLITKGFAGDYLSG